MFDFTQNIKLDSENYKKYTIGRILLHILFVVFVLYVADRVLLPSAIYGFMFNAPSNVKNTIINPHPNNDILTSSNGNVNSNNNLTFFSMAEGIFSKATVLFSVDSKKSQSIENSKISIRKSYQSFFYPVGDPIGFRDGSLLTSNGQYYIISQGLLRKFDSIEIVNKLGFNHEAFAKVSPSDLQYNKTGDAITSTSAYPDDSVFKVEKTYYQLKKQQLLPFVSERAFLTHFDQNQAIPKDSDIFSAYPVSQTSIGYADGTLASANISVYILSDGKNYPIANPQTFESMGFDWNNVIPIGSDELSLYQQQKQFNINDPHPDGTLFFDNKTQQYSIIEKGKRRLITTAAIAKNYSKLHPITVDSSSLDKSVSCQLKKVSGSNYECSLSLQDIRDNVGNNYEISTQFTSDAKITNISTTFSSSVTWQNIRTSLSGIKMKLMSNYGIKQNP